MGGVGGVYEWPSSRHHWFQPSSNCCPQDSRPRLECAIQFRPLSSLRHWMFFFCSCSSSAGVRTCVWVTPINAQFLATPPPGGVSSILFFPSPFPASPRPTLCVSGRWCRQREEGEKRGKVPPLSAVLLLLVLPCCSRSSMKDQRFQRSDSRQNLLKRRPVRAAALFTLAPKSIQFDRALTHTHHHLFGLFISSPIHFVPFFNKFVR